MTVDGNTIKCEASECRAASMLESATVISPEYLRVRFAMKGWTAGHDDGELDFCPDH
jgi:hypothetical protein